MTKHWLIRGNSAEVLRHLDDESIHLVVTSPPYFNAREYSQWPTLEEYVEDMRVVFTGLFRVLDNHRTLVLNVGDVQCRLARQPWTMRRVPLGAIFTMMLSDIGFEFVDDFIWDKGEPESFRHIRGGRNYPFYMYPVNCYEHILIFHKHRQDMTRIPCPVCGTAKVQNNSQSEIGVQSWECNNDMCSHRSPGNRGKRYSARSIMMDRGQTSGNEIEKDLTGRWRRDIVRFSPVIKWIDGKNIVGHSAPFPEEIPEMAVRFYTYEGDTVLDPFAGSFTTSFVALKERRNSIGIEINREFYDVGKERLGADKGSVQVTLDGEKPEFILIEERSDEVLDDMRIPVSKVWNKGKYIDESETLDDAQ